jgi:alpha-beta hydrolase superfamily lysophospholipase
VTFLIAVAVGVLLVALAHLVVGWALSNGLHRNALAVQARPREFAVRVREVSASEIVLEAPVPRQDIGHPGTLGLAWDNGHGVLGEVLSADGMRVTRQFTPGVGPRTQGSRQRSAGLGTLGSLPPVCEGDLEGCAPVEIDPYVYPGDPTDVGLEFENVTYDAPLGPTAAWLVPGASPGRWAVLCHGWTAEKRELIRMLPSFHSRGYSTLVIDYRNDPGAPRDPTGRYRFGLNEWEDLEAAIGLTRQRGVDHLVIGGCSTGAALVMAFLERSELGDEVAGVVLDAPNVILAEAVRHGTRERRVTPLMVEFGLWMADVRWKIDWEATDYVQRADQTLQVPTLVFHGTSDQVIPISVSRQLETRAPSVVELVETPAAGHVMSWNADPERYEGYLTRFLDRI